MAPLLRNEWHGRSEIAKGTAFEPEVAQTTPFYVSAILEGCESPKAAAVATVQFRPPAPIVNDASRCGPGAISVTATGAVSGSTYRWYTSNDAQTPVLTEEATYAESGATVSTKLYVAVRMQDTGCESPREEVALNILPIPAQPEVGDAYVCEGGAGASLEVHHPLPGYKYEWYSQTPIASTGLLGTGIRFFTGQLSGSTSYYVQAVAGACRSEEKEAKALFVKDEALAIGADTLTCFFGAAIELDTGLPDAFKGQGQFTGPGVFARRFEPHSLEEGSYEVVYQANLGSCPVAGKRTIAVQKGVGTKVLPLQDASLSLCPENLPYNLSGMVSDYPGGIFTGTGVNGQSFTATQGAYPLVYTLDTAGCRYETPLQITVLENTTPVPEIKANQAVYCPESPVLLEALSNGAQQFYWYEQPPPAPVLHEGASYAFPAAEKTLFVLAAGVNGCRSTATEYQLAVRYLPENIQASPTAIAVGELVQFQVLPEAASPKQAAITYAWDFGNGETSEQASPAVFYHSPDTFTVNLAVENGPCRKLLSTHVQVVGEASPGLITSLETSKSLEAPQAYPQPVESVLQLHLPGMGAKPWSCHIYDLQGKLCYQDELQEEEAQIPVTHWAKGMYLILLSQGKQVFTLKTVKK